MSKFRKKPVVIEANQLSRSNGEELANWCGGAWLSLYGRGDNGEDISHVAIKTLEGTMRADLGDWIIRGVQGEFYPCKPDIFAATYEPADSAAPGGDVEPGYWIVQRTAGATIVHNAESGDSCIVEDSNKGPMAEVLRQLAQDAEKWGRPSARIVGMRMINGVPVQVAKPASELLPEILLVTYDEYLKAAALSAPKQVGASLDMEIMEELERAVTKFPTWPTDPIHAVAVLNEEVGELNKALLQSVYEPNKVADGDVRSEAVQVAAMAVRFLRSLPAYRYAKSEQHQQTITGEA